jgi:hypothetical protein
VCRHHKRQANRAFLPIIQQVGSRFRDALADDPRIGQKDEIAVGRRRGPRLARRNERGIALLPDCDAVIRLSQ